MSLKIGNSILGFCFLTFFAGFNYGHAEDNTPSAEADMINVYSFTLKTIDGNDQSLSVYKGKVLLLVNTASLCGYTHQYKPLEGLYKKYQPRGFEILAFPANNFGSQEPGNNQEIKQFCTRKYSITFPLFEKISVKGDDIHPLYQYLTTGSGFDGPIKWNFNKFLVDTEGRVVARYDSGVDPMSVELTARLEEILTQ